MDRLRASIKQRIANKQHEQNSAVGRVVAQMFEVQRLRAKARAIETNVEAHLAGKADLPPPPWEGASPRTPLEMMSFAKVNHDMADAIELQLFGAVRPFD